jgi:NADH dehydrogenase (ubiquinone) 1 alpha subcomplex subunit 6
MIIVLDYDVPITVPRLRTRIREEFDKNRHVSDLRAIDLLVVKVIYLFLNENGYL